LTDWLVPPCTIEADDATAPDAGDPGCHEEGEHGNGRYSAPSHPDFRRGAARTPDAIEFWRRCIFHRSSTQVGFIYLREVAAADPEGRCAWSCVPPCSHPPAPSCSSGHCRRVRGAGRASITKRRVRGRMNPASALGVRPFHRTRSGGCDLHGTISYYTPDPVGENVAQGNLFRLSSWQMPVQPQGSVGG